VGEGFDPLDSVAANRIWAFAAGQRGRGRRQAAGPGRAAPGGQTADTEQTGPGKTHERRGQKDARPPGAPAPARLARTQTPTAEERRANAESRTGQPPPPPPALPAPASENTALRCGRASTTHTTRPQRNGLFSDALPLGMRAAGAAAGVDLSICIFNSCASVIYVVNLRDRPGIASRISGSEKDDPAGDGKVADVTHLIGEVAAALPFGVVARGARCAAGEVVADVPRVAVQLIAAERAPGRTVANCDCDGEGSAQSGGSGMV